MVTVILTMQLEFPPISSLKEKRRILKSLLTRLRNDFNVSIAEVGDNDVIRRALVGCAVVSNSSSFGHQVIAKLVRRVESDPQIVLVDYRTETY